MGMKSDMSKVHSHDVLHLARPIMGTTMLAKEFHRAFCEAFSPSGSLRATWFPPSLRDPGEPGEPGATAALAVAMTESTSGIGSFKFSNANEYLGVYMFNHYGFTPGVRAGQPFCQKRTTQPQVQHLNFW